MPTSVGSTFPTYIDVVKRLDPDGNIAKIAEVLNQKVPLLNDIPWVEGNLSTGHRFTQRTALPSPSWSRLNKGVPFTKSTTDQIDETCGILEMYNPVDVRLAEMAPDAAAFRLSEDLGAIEGFNQKISTGMFYSDVTVTPEQFEGLAPRLASTSASNPAAGQIVKGDASASGANQTSIYLIGWDPEKVFGIFPKGSKGGLSMEDLGRRFVNDAASNPFDAHVTRFVWKVGLVVKDWRFVSRGCNIDVNRWKADLSQGADLALLMNDLMTAVFDLAQCRPRFYMARATYGMLAKQLVKRQANWLEMVAQKDGTRIPFYMGIPISFTDSLTLTEAVVS